MGWQNWQIRLFHLYHAKRRFRMCKVFVGIYTGGGMSLVLISLSICIGIGIITYHLVEKPISDFISKRERKNQKGETIFNIIL